MSEEELKPYSPIQYDVVGKQVLAWAKDPTEFKVLDCTVNANEFGAANLAALKARLNDKQIEMPPRIKKIVVVQGDDETFILRLPPKKQVEQSEAGIDKDIAEGKGKDPDAYVAPDFYDTLTDGTYDMRTFYHSRIADYSIRGCR